MLRAQALYHDDKDVQDLRQSHENPAVKQLYETFLYEPLGERSHQLLHTHYVKRGV
jgi:iron only hydrogenase large subunit-like protein